MNKKDVRKIALCMSFIALLSGCAKENRIKENFDNSAYELETDYSNDGMGIYHNYNNDRTGSYLSKDLYANTYLIDDKMNDNKIIVELVTDNDVIISIKSKKYYMDNNSVADVLVSDFTIDDLIKLHDVYELNFEHLDVLKVENMLLNDSIYPLEQNHIVYNNLEYVISKDSNMSRSLDNMFDNLKNNKFDSYDYTFEGKEYEIQLNMFNEIVKIYERSNSLEEISPTLENEIKATIEKSQTKVLKK